ncbi:MAG: PadR family transcriptional regulator [Candidatus Bathyarchaeia archaeon]
MSSRDENGEDPPASETTYNRLVRKMTKENLWLYILRLLREEAKYGYEIRGEIEEHFGFKPGRVTSYRVLYTLQRDGCVEVKGEEPSKEGPSRKYYIITAKGEDLFKKAEAFLTNLCRKLFQ